MFAIIICTVNFNFYCPSQRRTKNIPELREVGLIIAQIPEFPVYTHLQLDCAISNSPTGWYETLISEAPVMPQKTPRIVTDLLRLKAPFYNFYELCSTPFQKIIYYSAYLFAESLGRGVGEQLGRNKPKLVLISSNLGYLLIPPGTFQRSCSNPE